MTKEEKRLLRKDMSKENYKIMVNEKLYNELRGSAWQRYEKCQKQVISEAFNCGYEKGFLDGLKYNEKYNI